MKQLISILLSFLLLLSSSGITYAQHFCGGHKMMEKVTFGEETLSCGMALKENVCGEEKTEKHSCCNNQYTSVDIDDSFHKSSGDFSFKISFVIAFISVFDFYSFSIDKEFLTSYTDYNPPPNIKDIPVLYKSFLI